MAVKEGGFWCCSVADDRDKWLLDLVDELRERGRQHLLCNWAPLLAPHLVSHLAGWKRISMFVTIDVRQGIWECVLGTVAVPDEVQCAFSRFEGSFFLGCCVSMAPFSVYEKI